MRRSPFVLLAALLLAFGGAVPALGQSLGDLADIPIRLTKPRVESAGKQQAYTFESEAIERPIQGVVLRGTSSDRALEGSIRFYREGSWSDWHRLYIVFSATEGIFLAGYRADDALEPSRFEVRFSLEGTADLHLHGAAAYDDRDGEETAPPAELPDRSPRSVADPSDHVLPLGMISRDAWGARPFIGDPAPLAQPTYRAITLHHAAGFGAVTLEEGLEQVRRIQDFHQNGRGWSDIGYQFVMDQSGRLYQGRPFQNEPVRLADVPSLVLGAHVGGHNTGNIGLCLLGCFHPSEGSWCRDELTPAALDSLTTIFAFFSEAYGVPPERIYGHRDFSNTACPGDNNYALLPEIEARVRTLLLTGNAPVGLAELTATSEADGVVRLHWTFLEDHGIARYRIERVREGASTVVYEAEGTAVPETFVDTGVRVPGRVVYRLYATNEAGREQLLTATEVEVTVPDVYVLAPNFPNPATDRTTIRYYLPHDGLARLTLYDVTGRELTVIDDAFRDGGQWHVATLSVADLAAGLYLYRLRVDGFSGTTFVDTLPLVVSR